ncbi:hypothetical protein ES319_D12G182200v1 [Gossypium barbadense]|uniref:Uncharacterized protein n=1 Tax=Gossypium barbadense TaxID=3634 RepID=A0A5J5P066_GOSBA|nr:hypothetical protein ES319_D12G182200v1 [Gossypium barbadense]
MDSDSINRKSKNSSKRVKFKDENGNSKHSSEDSGSSNDSDALSEVLNSIEGTISNGNSGIIKGSGNKNDVEIHEGPKDESGSSNRSEVAQGEIDRSKGDFSTENISSPSSSSSSSLSSPSSGSSTDDKSQADTQESGISGLTSGKSSSIIKQTQNGSAGSKSNSQVPIVAQESALTQSPPIQVMDRGVEEYDPYRIPSAVFSISKSPAPMDWSLASNDSLFSIKVGSTSFARDLIQNKETARGVEKPGEVKALIPFPAVAPTYTENFEFDIRKETVVSDDTAKDKQPLLLKNQLLTSQCQLHPGISPIFLKCKLIAFFYLQNNPIYLWIDVLNISFSFCKTSTFYLGVYAVVNTNLMLKNKSKKKKCAWPSCSCSGCSWAFCYCSNYSCALCYCWNCSLKRFFCCCSDSEDESNVSEEEKVRQKLQEKPNVSKKEEVQQKQQEKPLASALKSKSACSNCCSWFPSCRWRWCCSFNRCKGKCCC